MRLSWYVLVLHCFGFMGFVEQDDPLQALAMIPSAI